MEKRCHTVGDGGCQPWHRLRHRLDMPYLARVRARVGVWVGARVRVRARVRVGAGLGLE